MPFLLNERNKIFYGVDANSDDEQAVCSHFHHTYLFLSQFLGTFFFRLHNGLAVDRITVSVSSTNNTRTLKHSIVCDFHVQIM